MCEHNTLPELGIGYYFELSSSNVTTRCWLVWHSVFGEVNKYVSRKCTFCNLSDVFKSPWYLSSEASELPLSIIIVGVGDADFSDMERLDADDKLWVLNNYFLRISVTSYEFDYLFAAIDLGLSWGIWLIGFFSGYPSVIAKQRETLFNLFPSEISRM